MSIDPFDNRLIQISELLANYSLGDFDHEIELSNDLDEIDSILSGVNMLGEELKTTTISRDFFSDIFKAVGDMLFVLDAKGNIKDCNSSATELLQREENELTTNPIQDCFAQSYQVEFKRIYKSVFENGETQRFESLMISKSNEALNVMCAFSKITNRKGEHDGFVLIAKDITQSKQLDNRILQTIVDTQEKEQARVANDLHDSLGQELSAIKMMLSNVTQEIKKESLELSVTAQRCLELVDSTIQDLRDICFNLVPSALEDGNFITALNQLIYKLQVSTKIKFILKIDMECVSLSKNKKLALYRVTQEFINNTIKHADAKEVHISATSLGGEFVYTIQDDGVGFDIVAVDGKISRGTSTMRKRIEVLGGEMTLRSKIGIGTGLVTKFLIK